MFKFLSRLFDNPSDYDGQPLKWLRNQIGHAVIVAGIGALWVMTFGYVLAIYTDHRETGLWLLWNAPWIVGGCYSLWEIGQYRWRSAGLVDCLTDWLFVACGGAMVHSAITAQWEVAGVCAVFLTAAGICGAIRRA